MNGTELEIVEKSSHLKIKYDAFAEDHVDIKRSACLKEWSKTNPLQAMRSIEIVAGRCDKKGKWCLIWEPFRKRKKQRDACEKEDTNGTYFFHDDVIDISTEYLIADDK